MICLRCGHCCKTYCVIIVDDPKKGITDSNLVPHMGDGTPCKHLQGSKPGEYTCALHDYPWYKDTPCFAHGQIESSPDCECRLGRYILDSAKEKTS